MMSNLLDRFKFILRAGLRPLFRAEFISNSKFAPSLKVAQTQLFLKYRMMKDQNQTLPALSDTGYRVYSQFEEDGMVVFLFAILGTTSKKFIDVGSSDGIDSNCANLAINFGWHGLFIDGSKEKVAKGEGFYGNHPDTTLFPPKFIQAMIKRENVNELIEEAGFKGEIDFMSVDIDGNDYWIWDALEVVQPRVVVIETSVEFGYNDVVVPYDPDHVYPGKHPNYHGASAVAMVKMAEKKGYRLVGANQLGFNTIYVRHDEGLELIPTVKVEDVLRHPRNEERFKLFEPIKDLEYVRGGE